MPRAKIEEYLLSLGHPVGGAKARYLIARGYDPDAPEVLEKHLRVIAETGRVESTEATDWGTKYLVVGSVRAPDGESLELATILDRPGRGRPSVGYGIPVEGRMSMNPHDTVVLRRPLPDFGLEKGDVGAIVHRHADDAFEVEFVSGEGATVAVVTLGASDLRPVSAGDMLHVRNLARS